MDEFRAGVTAVLRTWSAFRTAVESYWGGDDSFQKAEDLRRNILDHFNGSSVPPPSMPDVTDLEDALAIYMEEEFSLQLEDNSEKEIAQVIWLMYEQCSKGNYQLAIQMVESAEHVVAKVKALYPVQIQASENDDESDDEEMTAAAPQNADTEHSPQLTMVTEPILQRNYASLAEYASFPLFGPLSTKPPPKSDPVRQLGEHPVVTKPALELDEDGFAPVRRKR
jgi:pre-rRNA-processing protein TSR2